MKISSIQLMNFKRFSDLTIEQIPPDTKFVLLTGANGSGKSSVFDAFRFTEHSDPEILMSYYQKNGAIPITVTINVFGSSNYIYCYDGKEIDSGLNSDSFYGRTSFRHVPRLNITKLKEPRTKLRRTLGIEPLSQNPLFIDKDNYFESDIEIISQRILTAVFRSKTTSDEIHKNYIQPINDAFGKIFDSNGDSTKLKLIEILPPLDGNIAQINFRKGDSEIHYNLLSAGEKEVVNILFNLLVRKDELTNTIYYLDELDLHLNTALQYNLIKEIVENWIPDNCQLWTASHSLGFIDYASDTENAIILDFDNLDFDKPQVITPTDKKDYQVFEIAVGKQFIDKVFQDKKIVFAENKDAVIYNDLSFPNTFFFTAIDKLDVFSKSKNLKTWGLIDRDYLTDKEVEDLLATYPNVKILPFYSIENLYYHPDNLQEHCINNNIDFERGVYINQIISNKNNNLMSLVYGLSKARDGYPFFKENEHAKRLKEFRENSKVISEILKSDEFDAFYKVYPMKDNNNSVLEKLNIKNKELSKTKWFKEQIEQVIRN